MARAKRKAKPSDGRLEIEYLQIDDITPYEYNPRDNTLAIPVVAESIREFGFLIPVVVDKDNVLLAGHTRVEAAKTLGLTEVPSVRADRLSDRQAQAFRVIDNKTNEIAEWDRLLLSQEALEISQNLDLTRFGYTQEYIDCLTQVVEDDCLSAGVAVGEESSRERNEARAPSRTRYVIGEFVFYTDSHTYRLWANQIRTECGFSEAAISEHLKGLLGLTGYEQEGDGHG